MITKKQFIKNKIDSFLTDSQTDKMESCCFVGCWGPGTCDENIPECSFDAVIPNIFYDGKFSACPQGSRPVFWTEKLDEQHGKVHYNCCNPSSFTTSQIQSYEREPDNTYCLDQKNTFYWQDFFTGETMDEVVDYYGEGGIPCCDTITAQLESVAKSFFTS